MAGAMGSIADAPGIKVGDTITIPILVRRKWWQFWRPKYSPPATKTFWVTGVTTSTIIID